MVRTLPEKKIVVRMREQHAAVHALVEQGLSKAAIGRQLGLHPATVRKLAWARSVHELTAKTEQRAHRALKTRVDALMALHRIRDTRP